MRELDGVGLAGGEDLAVRRLGERRVLLPVQQVVEMAEGLLLGNDGDVVFRGVGDQLARLGLGE